MSQICPICLRDLDKYDFEKHHVVWRAFGGSNDPVNILPICCDCHQCLTYEKTETARLKDVTCFVYQLANHGLSFLLKSNVLFAEHKTVWREDRFVEKYKDWSAETLDYQLREVGYYCYRENLNKLNGTPFDKPLPWEIAEDE